MERRHITDTDELSGYNALRIYQVAVPTRSRDEWSFAPNTAYDTYLKIPKAFVDESGGELLENIAKSLEDEWMPGYLNAAGWASAEAALVQKNSPAVGRIKLVDQAADYWERALISQEQINNDPSHEWLRSETAPYRIALNLAFVPLMKSLVTGNVTDTIREQTFADTLAIAQASTIQRTLASQVGNIDAVGDHIGFEHECNALLTLLYMDDPRHVPLPSLARSGTGYDYPDQTHDIVVINQHWGDILKVVPIEIKAKATLRDLKRYKALIVRGKMHLSVPGKYSPEHTLNAFAAMYEGTGTWDDQEIVNYATSTMRELLQLYQRGKRVLVIEHSGQTRFHDRDEVIGNYPEFSLNKSRIWET